MHVSEQIDDLLVCLNFLNNLHESCDPFYHFIFNYLDQLHPFFSTHTMSKLQKEEKFKYVPLLSMILTQ